MLLPNHSCVAVLLLHCCLVEPFSELLAVLAPLLAPPSAVLPLPRPGRHRPYSCIGAASPAAAADAGAAFLAPLPCFLLSCLGPLFLAGLAGDAVSTCSHPGGHGAVAEGPPCAQAGWAGQVPVPRSLPTHSALPAPCERGRPGAPPASQTPAPPPASRLASGRGSPCADASAQMTNSTGQVQMHPVAALERASLLPPFSPLCAHQTPPSPPACASAADTGHVSAQRILEAA